MAKSAIDLYSVLQHPVVDCLLQVMGRSSGMLKQYMTNRNRETNRDCYLATLHNIYAEIKELTINTKALVYKLGLEWIELPASLQVDLFSSVNNSNFGDLATALENVCLVC
ncbi:hypothetical protein QOT17_019291 [Balamuthia mandrillaris]